jgi:hypothetical protein
MSFPEHSPYELLGVAPGATAAEISQAYQQAVRARRHPANRLSQAFNELRNPRSRLEHDLLFYETPEVDQALYGILSAAEDVPLLPVAQLVVPPGELVAFDAATVAEEWRPVRAASAKLVPSARFAATPAVLPPPELPG